MAFRACTVSFVYHGQRHEARVDAETVYEAAALALKFFGTRRYMKGPRRGTVLTIETTRPAAFLAEVKVGVVLDWLYERPSQDEVTAARKVRLRGILADDRR
jgi:hypothetical protein